MKHLPQKGVKVVAKSNFIVRGGADFSGINNSFKQLQNDLKGYQSALGKTLKGIGVALGSLAIGKLIKDSKDVAMQVEASIQQIERIMGENAKSFQKWANNQAIAFGMSKAEAKKYGAVYGNLISGFAKDTNEATDYTLQLLKASAIVASGTGRTMEDVMERIRSGLLGNTEAIEDLGINVNIAMIESTNAFKKFANGKSWQQLDFQTQQQIRLFAILEQASKKYGDSINKNTNSAQQQFIAHLKNAQLSLGQAFLPIYNIILPALTSLAQSLAYVMNIIAQFSQALFGKSQAQEEAKGVNKEAGAVNNLGDAYKDAGKKAKGALMGFDEINQLADNSSGGASVMALTDMGGQQGEEIIGGGIAEGATEVSEKVQEMAIKIKTAFLNIADVVGDTVKVVAVFFGAWKLAELLAFIQTSGGVVAALKTLTSATWANIAAKTADKAETVALTLLYAKDFLVSLAQSTAALIKNVAAWAASTAAKAAGTVATGLATAAQWALVAATTAWNAICVVATTVTTAFGSAIAFLTSPIGLVIMAVTALIAGIVLLVKNWDDVKAKAFDVWESIKATWHAAGEWFSKNVVSPIGNAFSTMLNGIKKVLTTTWGSITSAFKSGINVVIDIVNFLITKLNKIKITVPEWVPGMGGKSWGINIPEIPKLARGGIIDSPTVAMLGESGKEAVVPLENTGFVNTIASAVGSAVLAALQVTAGHDGGDREVVIQIDSTKLARVMLPKLNRETQRIGSRPIIQTT